MRYIPCLLLILSGCSICMCATAQQQQQSIRKKTAHFQDPAVTKNTASASEQADFAPAVFPNYFSYMPEKDALALIDKSIASVLSRLQIPYVDPARPTKADGTPNILKKGFFIALEGMIQKQDPGAQVYIAGGVVRSILGYIYKKLYHDHQRALAVAVNRADVDMKALVVQTFDRIIDGHSRKEEPVMFHGHYISQRPAQDIDMLTALGIGSDLDILVKFSAGFKGDKNAIMHQATDFINSAENALGLRDDASSLKKSIVPIGDVKDYDTQVGTDRSGKNAVAQGGSSLDWLAFPVSIASGKSMVMPIDYQQIMHHFLKGELDYIPSPQQPTPDKQTIRGLRALLELPFLTYTANGFQVIRTELEALIAKGRLDHAAQEQIGKMMRNARFEGAKNRFSSSIQGVSADTIEGLVQQLAAKNSSVKIPEFMVKNDLVLRHGVDKGGLAKAGILMPVEVFIAQHTDQGVLYHGTPDFTNVLNMIRNGMVISKQNQGIAIHGRGVYTDNSRSVPERYAKDPERYAKDKGVVLELRVQPEGLRVLDWKTTKNKPELTNLFPNAATASGEDLDTLFETLARDYDIDVILNTFPLIQNAAAIKLPKKKNDLIKLQIQQAENSLKAYLAIEEKPAINNAQIMEWFNYLHPKGQFARFAHVVGIQPPQDMHAKVNGALLAYVKQADVDTVDTFVLSHGMEYWNTQEDQAVYAEALDVYKKYIEIQNGNRPVSDDFVACILALKQIGIKISAYNLQNLIPFLSGVNNLEKVTAGIIALTQEVGIFIHVYSLRDLITLLDAQKITPEIKQALKVLIQDAGMKIQVSDLTDLIALLDAQKITPEIIEKLKALKQEVGIFIYVSSLRDLIALLDAQKITPEIKQALKVLIQDAGIFIEASDLTDLIPVLENVKNVEAVTAGIIVLTQQAGIKIQASYLTNWLPVLDTVNNLEKVIAGIIALRQEVGIFIHVSSLRDWIALLDAQKITPEIIQALKVLIQYAGIFIQDSFLRDLISLLDTVNNLEKVTAGIIALKNAVIGISSSVLKDLLPVLDRMQITPEIIESLNTHVQETGRKLNVFELMNLLKNESPVNNDGA